MAIGSPGVCLEWSVGRALAAGATEDEIADVLLAIAPVAGLGRIVAAAPEVAIALGYYIAIALEELGDPTAPPESSFSRCIAQSFTPSGRWNSPRREVDWYQAGERRYAPAEPNRQ